MGSEMCIRDSSKILGVGAPIWAEQLDDGRFEYSCTRDPDPDIAKTSKSNVGVECYCYRPTIAIGDGNSDNSKCSLQRYTGHTPRALDAQRQMFQQYPNNPTQWDSGGRVSCMQRVYG